MTSFKKRMAIMLSCMFLLATFAIGCNKDVVYDYTASELKIEKREQFAPCSFYDFLYNNEHTKTYFEEIFPLAIRNYKVFEITIKGEMWTALRIAQNELPIGIYDIVVETSEHAYFYEINADGETVKVPYQKKLTIPVSVWKWNKDKYGKIE